MHPYRSVLYMPGSNARALEKARSLPADALIFDLEDAVVPEAKEKARNLIAGAIAEGGYAERRILIRINGLDSPWGAEDLEAAISVRPHAILLPKVSRPREAEAVSRTLDMADPNHPTRLWAMIETPRGVLNAGRIAKVARMEGFIIGTNDLMNDLQVRHRPDRMPLLPALANCLLAARAHGLVCIDGVCNAFRDENGLLAECEQGRDMGFDGKSLIHPAQIAAANRVFAPSAEELELARARIAAYEDAVRKGSGVAVLDASIVENLHVESARRMLAIADAIARVRNVSGE